MVCVEGETMSRHDQRGATAVEYALLIAFFATVIVASVVLLGDDLVALVASVPQPGPCLRAVRAGCGAAGSGPRLRRPSSPLGLFLK